MATDFNFGTQTSNIYLKYIHISEFRDDKFVFTNV